MSREGVEYGVRNTEKEGSMKKGVGRTHTSGREAASTSLSTFPTSIDDVGPTFKNNHHCLTLSLFVIIKIYCH